MVSDGNPPVMLPSCNKCMSTPTKGIPLVRISSYACFAHVSSALVYTAVAEVKVEVANAV